MISFIIPAHDEERLLGATLAALTGAIRSLDESVEVIVVDDASTDRTREIATSAGARVLPVSLRHIAAVRNAGARASRGECLIFIDADTLVNEGVVKAAVSAMRNGAAAGGAVVLWDDLTPRWARAIEVTTRISLRIGRMAAGCFLFCTREAFDQVGGFDERLYICEELAFSRALKQAGPFVMLSETVVTSSRKLRTYSALEMLKTTAAVIVRGPAGLCSPGHLQLWYGPRREE